MAGAPRHVTASGRGVAELSRRLAVVRERIADAGGDPAGITIVAVTKGFGADVVAGAVAGGLVDVGENYGQELVAKAGAVPGARWHFVGAVQRNKVKALAPLVHLWHGVDRAGVADAVARHAPGAPVLVQVNVSGEPTKAGCAWAEVDGLVAHAAGLGLDVRGLMAIGPAGPPESARPGFRRLRETADDLELRECSMGMSADLEVAVAEGATIVRLGTALFGPRPARREMRR
jgi:pyridoxal phosphate enzyme (YggS family)